MDSKQLLVKTVEAIGDAELRRDHENLKQLQFQRGNFEGERKFNEF